MNNAQAVVANGPTVEQWQPRTDSIHMSIRVDDPRLDHVIERGLRIVQLDPRHLLTTFVYLLLILIRGMASGAPSTSVDAAQVAHGATRWLLRLEKAVSRPLASASSNPTLTGLFSTVATAQVNGVNRRRSALAMTETELKLMAAAAIMGLSKADMPKIGTRTPAATGTPSAL